MPDYRRHRVPGATYFFTVNLFDRRSDLLVVHIEALRDAVRKAHRRRPFHIDAWVVLPDHMHCLWTLPKAIRISRAAGETSKPPSQNPYPRRSSARPLWSGASNAGFGNADIGSKRSGMTAIMPRRWTMSISTR